LYYKIIGIADQLNSPYGNKSNEENLTRTLQCIDWLIKQGATDILIACNTATAVALDTAKKRFDNADINGIIDITAQQLSGLNYKIVLVLATKSTVDNKAYPIAIKSYLPSAKVSQKALPDLVDYLEDGANTKVVRSYLKSNISSYYQKVEAVVLGCTHYVLVKDIVEEILQVPVYDSNQAIAEYCYPWNKKDGQQVKIFTTKDESRLKEQMLSLFDFKVKVEKAII
jgi:glutamate racemase